MFSYTSCIASIAITASSAGPNTANGQSADGRLMALTVPAITERDIGAATPKPEVSWADCSASFEPFSTGTHGVARELAFLYLSPVLPAWRHHRLRGHWTCRACAASTTREGAAVRALQTCRRRDRLICRQRRCGYGS
jgi:hypothetical protein